MTWKPPGPAAPGEKPQKKPAGAKGESLVEKVAGVGYDSPSDPCLSIHPREPPMIPIYGLLFLVLRALALKLATTER
ncbi:MAG: hypothetical protein A2X84_08610 [Desulfuromonadaceae bacterium GWC2_58_13]|nr:MAG: hypothetical protein A2X84_08610 [Desulfuromonadaceae bacterium GWC2_58_13]